MFNKLKKSLDRALISQKWHLGDVAGRIGHPFTWADTGAKPLITHLDNTNGLMHYYYMYYIVKKTPKFIKTNKTNFYSKSLFNLFKSYFFRKYPYLKTDKQNVQSFKAQSMARAQDLSFIKKYAKSLKKKINVLDVGPGMCGMLPTLELEYTGKYYAVESDFMTYSSQLEFLKLYCYENKKIIYDVIEAEDYKNLNEIKKQIKKENVIHLPSWHFELIEDNSIDLSTAMFMLNELSYSGIFWVISNITRKLKVGGFLYVRDSNILKPGCHNFDYNKELLNLGYEEVAFYKIKNRLDFFGIPRIYKKVKNKKINFKNLTKKYLGKYASVASGADRGYNLEKK
jgi:hypothetical protein